MVSIIWIIERDNGAMEEMHDRGNDRFDSCSCWQELVCDGAVSW